MQRSLYALSEGQRESEIFNQPATLSDLRKALAEHGMVAVPVEPDHGLIKQMELARQNCKSYYFPDCMEAAYDTMIQAAQEEN